MAKSRWFYNLGGRLKSKILNCTCHHEFQDERYGKGRRVHNPLKVGAKGQTPSFRCTVCEKVREK